MKKFIIFLGIVVVLLIGAVLIVPKMVPVDKIKPIIQAKVKDATGRDLKIDGKIKVHVFPNLAVRLNKVSLSNAEWGKAEHFVSLDELDAQLKLMPFLEKRIEIDRFVLHAPRIALEVSKSGKGNWEFPAAAPSKETEETATETSNAAQDFEIRFGEFKITDGVVRYEDLKTSDEHVLDKINVMIAATKMDAPISLEGEGQYRARKLSWNFSADKLSALIASKPFTGKLGLDVEPFASFSAEGKFMESASAYLSAKVKTEIKDINAVLNWASPTQKSELPIQAVNFSTDKLRLKKKGEAGISAQLAGMTMQVDEWGMTGDLTFSQSGKAPANISADLKIPEVLDVHDLMQKMSSGAVGTAEEGAAPETAKTTQQGWSEDEIDFSAVRMMNGKLSLAHQGLVYKNLKSSAGKAVVTLSNGKLVFDMPATKVDSGTLSVRAGVTEAGKDTGIDLDMKAKDMPIKPLLTAFADLDKLSGAGQVSFVAKAKGNTQKAIVSSLNGVSELALQDGMLHGVDFVNMTKMVQKRLMDVGLGDGGTKFTDFNAKFDIKNGIMTNNDLHLVGPLVEAKGAGTIDLPKQAMRYRVTPHLILKKTTQNNEETGETVTTKTGLAVPVDIKGPWANLKIKPDYKAVIRKAFSNPDDLEDTAKDIGKELENQVKSLEDSKDQLENELKQLKGLFGQ